MFLADKLSQAYLQGRPSTDRTWEQLEVVNVVRSPFELELQYVSLTQHLPLWGIRTCAKSTRRFHIARVE